MNDMLIKKAADEVYDLTNNLAREFYEVLRPVIASKGATTCTAESLKSNFNDVLEKYKSFGKSNLEWVSHFGVVELVRKTGELFELQGTPIDTGYIEEDDCFVFADKKFGLEVR